MRRLAPDALLAAACLAAAAGAVTLDLQDVAPDVGGGGSVPPELGLDEPFVTSAASGSAFTPVEFAVLVALVAIVAVPLSTFLKNLDVSQVPVEPGPLRGDLPEGVVGAVSLGEIDPATYHLLVQDLP